MGKVWCLARSRKEEALIKLKAASGFSRFLAIEIKAMRDGGAFRLATATYTAVILLLGAVNLYSNHMPTIEEGLEDTMGFARNTLDNSDVSESEEGRSSDVGNGNRKRKKAGLGIRRKWSSLHPRS